MALGGMLIASSRGLRGPDGLLVSAVAAAAAAAALARPSAMAWGGMLVGSSAGSGIGCDEWGDAPGAPNCVDQLEGLSWSAEGLNEGSSASLRTTAAKRLHRAISASQ